MKIKKCFTLATNALISFCRIVLVKIEKNFKLSKKSTRFTHGLFRIVGNVAVRFLLIPDELLVQRG